MSWPSRPHYGKSHQRQSIAARQDRPLADVKLGFDCLKLGSKLCDDPQCRDLVRGLGWCARRPGPEPDKPTPTQQSTTTPVAHTTTNTQQRPSASSSAKPSSTSRSDGTPSPQPESAPDTLSPLQPTSSTSSNETTSPAPLPPSLASSRGIDSGSQSVEFVPGTPTTSTFTSLVETVSRDDDGIDHTKTIASTGITTVTPSVPAPTDPDGGFAPGTVGASSRSTNVGAIIGGVLGALALLVLCAFGFLLYQRRKRGRIAPSSEFLRRYAGQMPTYTQNPYHHAPYPGEKS